MHTQGKIIYTHEKENLGQKVDMRYPTTELSL